MDLLQRQYSETEESTTEANIKWINLIFLPYNPIFRFIILITVIVKCVMGPLIAVYNFTQCTQSMDEDLLLSYIKAFYVYFADPIYCVDTFLHILHRQVEDEARKREYVPKTAFALLLDILSLMPLYNMMAGKNICQNVKIWPNILSFNEILIIYQVVEYFSLHTTHSIGKLTTGYIIMIALAVNAIICLLMLATFQGLCAACGRNKPELDWRFDYRNATTETHIHLYGSLYVMSYLFLNNEEYTPPRSYTEFIIFAGLMVVGYTLFHYALVPKYFSESLLRNKRIFTFTPRVVRIIEETKRRSPLCSAYKEIEYFYSILWRKRMGIASIPEVINELPTYLKKNIRQDLVWAVFFHSPVFRKTSSAYKRWLSEFINLEFKLPGERFYTGSNCFTNMYYIKSGVVQIFSTDDCSSPILSVTSGTVFGDCSFIIPPLNRKLVVRCLTYCEVFVVSRTDVLISLHKFPEDRRVIMKAVRDKINHAKGLFACKVIAKGTDRAVDEGVAWLKKRWWEISGTIARYKRSKREQKFEMPVEETNYHCAKYIGQLVLGREEQLRKTSMFVNIKFPYLLAPYTTFGYIWNLIIYAMVWINIVIFPPNIAKSVESHSQHYWFMFIKTFTSILYILDVCVSLITTIDGEDNINTLGGIAKYRLKSIYFYLDLLATGIIDDVILIVSPRQIHYVIDFAVFSKIYVLFLNKYERNWRRRRDPVLKLLSKIALVHVLYMYVFPFSMPAIHYLIPEIRSKNFVVKSCKKIRNIEKCTEEYGMFSYLIGFNAFVFCFKTYYLKSHMENVLGICFIILRYIIYIYTRATYLSGLYMKNREIVNYQYYVNNLRKYFEDNKLHPDLLKRLERHLICHWKYFKGMDILHPNPLQDEPYDIYWRFQGEIAEKVIGGCEAFAGADPGLIKDLVHKSKFLVLPRNSTLVLFGLQMRTIMWLVNGCVKCEYHNDENELEKRFYSPIKLLTFSSIFLDRAPLRTYIAVSDCEILYIPYKDYVSVLHSYPDEKKYFHVCCQKFRPQYDDYLRASLTKHTVYQKKLREKILHGKKTSSVMLVRKKLGCDAIKEIFKNYRSNPESRFIIHWMRFRVTIAVLSVLLNTIPAIIGVYSPFFLYTDKVFEFIGYVDIVIKFFLPYYDERGLIISSKKKCILHYLFRGFAVDLAATLNVAHAIAAFVITEDDKSLLIFVNGVVKSTQIYLFLGHLNYLADLPTAASAVLMIIKWQCVVYLVLLLAAIFFTTKCIKQTWQGFQTTLTKRPTCWLPEHIEISKYPTVHEMQLVYATSVYMAQNALSRMAFTLFRVNVADIVSMSVIYLLLGAICWVSTCMCQVLIILYYRGDTLFQQNIAHFQNFLKTERVENHIIKRVIYHFEYWWTRTKGVNVQLLVTERIGVVFRQDLNYYFYKKTLEGVDSLLGGGEVLQRGLVGFVTQMFYLENQDVIREHDLASGIYFVHRGKVSITKKGKKLADLTKGSIFGQLDGKKIRPIYITACTQEKTDLLMIPINDFQQNITDKIRRNISNNPESKNDYLAVKHLIIDDPEASIEFMLRKKVFKIPRLMKEPIEVENKIWYFCWMLLTWFVGPVLGAFLVVMYDVVEKQNWLKLYITLIFLDVLYFACIVVEMFSMHLYAVGNKCEYKHKWLFKIFNLWLLVDILTFVMPLVAFIINDWRFTLARLARIHMTMKFYKNHCKNIKVKYLTTAVQIVLIALVLHILTCAWICIVCKDGITGAPVPRHTLEEYGPLDNTSWTIPQFKNGCMRIRTVFPKGQPPKRSGFSVPTHNRVNYYMTFFSIICTLTSTNSLTIIPYSMKSTLLKVFTNIVLAFLNLYICSLTVCNFYTKYRKKYHFDYKVKDLILCLKYNGLSDVLLTSVQEYCDKSWERQRGRSLPSIIKDAPLCLQQDVMSALYMHHLLTPVLFANLPHYFLRQLVTRLGRIVVFPENRLVREGDILPRMYFIHEGEVEKWYLDAAGEVRMGAVLSTNGYFGLIPGLFPNTPYQFTYYSRTVVDMVYLDFDAWQDLLNGYPDIKRQLYTAARKAKMNIK